MAARLVRTPVVEVTWREPASPNGIIVYYTVYATTPTVRLTLGGGQYSSSSLDETSIVRKTLRISYSYALPWKMYRLSQILATYNYVHIIITGRDYGSDFERDLDQKWVWCIVCLGCG